MVRKITEKLKGRRWIIVAVVPILVLLGGFLARDWLRVSVWARVFALQYKKDVHGITAESYYSLGNPLAYMGVPNLDHEPTECWFSQAQGLKTSFTCRRYVSGTKDLLTGEDFTAYHTWIKNLSKELINQGWSVNSEVSTVNGQPINNVGAADLNAIRDMFALYNKSYKGLACQFLLSYTDATDAPNTYVSADYQCQRHQYYFGIPSKS